MEAAIPEPNSGCFIWLKAVNSTSGYGVIRHSGKLWIAHRLAYQLRFDVILASDYDVCHRCDNRFCINPDHLFAGTRSDNMSDCSRKGRIRIPMLRGERLPQAKLTEHQVRLIRSDTRNRDQIAADYGVTKDTIRSIQARLTWRHVA